MQAKHLYFFTNTFPYGGESFVGNEISALAQYYDKIKLFSTSRGTIKDKLPANTELVSIEREQGGRSKLLLSNLPMIISIFLLDFVKNSDKKNVIRKFRYNLSVLLNTISLSEKLYTEIEKDPSEKRFVAFWMDEWTLALSILKYKKKLRHFVFRVHQHDLYLDGDPAQYIPFRYFNIKMTSAVFPDSIRGVKYLQDLNYYPEKMRAGHLGVIDKGTNPFDKNKFVIVSCSAMVSRKRVELIADILKLVKCPVTWIHFGAKGEPGLFDALKKKCSALPSNVSTILKGDVPYDELILFYRENPVSLFITLSRAEGLPVSVIEAVSFGIPCLVTDIMGLPDVVTEKSGTVISPDLEKEKIAGIIEAFPASNKNTIEYRNGVKEFWRKSFNAELNYKNFNEFISGLK